MYNINDYNYRISNKNVIRYWRSDKETSRSWKLMQVGLSELTFENKEHRFYLQGKQALCALKLKKEFIVFQRDIFSDFF